MSLPRRPLSRTASACQSRLIEWGRHSGVRIASQRRVTPRQSDVCRSRGEFRMLLSVGTRCDGHLPCPSSSDHSRDRVGGGGGRCFHTMPTAGSSRLTSLSHQAASARCASKGEGEKSLAGGRVAEPEEGALVGEHGRRGESPLQADVLRPVAGRNCVTARRGGEHREANGQSATKVNSIRPGCLASLPSYGEAQIGAIRKPTTLRGNV